MWDEIAITISQATGQKFTIGQQRAQTGGCINETMTVSDRDRHFFVKTNRANCLEMFMAEAIALQQIYATQTMRVPQPICWGTTGETAYLVMENLNLGGSQNWDAMGRKLAAMHHVTSDRGFGWDRHNTIGATPQVNDWTKDWLDFWINHRLGFQIKLARRKGWRCPIAESQVYDAIPALFADYQPQPAMVHGDLWGGNVGFADGEPVIFDPALYYGDREVDLAMTELFGGFPAQFYQAYQASYPLDVGYHRRKTLYNLYHILNHFNLFGGSYGLQASRMIQEVVK